MSPIRLSRLESSLRVVLEFNEAFNRHDIKGMMRLMSDDCLLESSAPPPSGAVHSGMEAIKYFWEKFFHTVPEAHIEIEDAFGFGERCVTRWKMTWADEQGRKKHVRGADIFRVRNELILEKLSYVKG